jgi:hypothetical protein
MWAPSGGLPDSAQGRRAIRGVEVGFRAGYADLNMSKVITAYLSPHKICILKPQSFSPVE